jgi:hypothetical protein
MHVTNFSLPLFLLCSYQSQKKTFSMFHGQKKSIETQKISFNNTILTPSQHQVTHIVELFGISWSILTYLSAL